MIPRYPHGLGDSDDSGVGWLVWIMHSVTTIPAETCQELRAINTKKLQGDNVSMLRILIVCRSFYTQVADTLILQVG